jgi:hypothetical protein
VEGHDGAELLSDTVEEETGHPELVTNCECCQLRFILENVVKVTHGQCQCKVRPGIPTGRA